jgi:hypothetical protein
MVLGTCDPASRGDAFNSGELAYGPVRVQYRYGWDGTSTKDTGGCAGPLVQGTGVASNRWAIKVENSSPVDTWYAHFKGRKGQPKVVEITPGLVASFNLSQCVARGFSDSTDVEGLLITQSLIPPADLKI